MSKKPKKGYISWWLFKTKGTIAEDWTSAEELKKSPHIKEVKDFLRRMNEQQKISAKKT